MKSTLFTRRFVTGLAALATLGLGAFALGLVLDSHALALFCVTACTLTTMIAVHDYAPTLSVASDAPAKTTPTSAARRHAERMPLAA